MVRVAVAVAASVVFSFGSVRSFTRSMPHGVSKGLC